MSTIGGQVIVGPSLALLDLTQTQGGPAIVAL